jgi:hypothetical protein
MSCIEGLIRQRAAQGEVRLKQALGVLFVGGLVRGYLPQDWAVITEEGVVNIQADVDGNIRVRGGPAAARDGEVRIAHDLLANGMRGRTRPPRDSYQVTFLSEKGKTAFDYLRGSFGL